MNLLRLATARDVPSDAAAVVLAVENPARLPLCVSGGTSIKATVMPVAMVIAASIESAVVSQSPMITHRCGVASPLVNVVRRAGICGSDGVAQLAEERQGRNVC